MGTWMRARWSIRMSVPARWSVRGHWNKMGKGGETRIKIYKRHKPDRANMKNMSRKDLTTHINWRATVCVPLGYRLSCWLNLHIRKWQPGPGGLQQLGRGPGLGLEEAAVHFYIT